MYEIQKIKIQKNPRNEIERLVKELEEGKVVLIAELPNIDGESEYDVYTKKEKMGYYFMQFGRDGEWTQTDIETILHMVYLRAWSLSIQQAGANNYYALDVQRA